MEVTDNYKENLRLLKARNPKDFPRLEAFLNSADGSTQFVPIPSDHKIRQRDFSPKAAILFNMFNRDAVKWFTSQPVSQEVQIIYFVDNNPDTVKQSLMDHDWRSYLMNPQYFFMFGMSEEQFGSTLYQSFNFGRVKESYRACIVEANPGLSDNEVDFYGTIKIKYDEVAKHYTSSLGYIEDYMEGVRATVSNTRLLMECKGIHDLKGLSQQRPALLVGAGPSLDTNIELIKQNESKFTIIAADASVKPLIEAGIRVDFCVSIERGNALQKEFWTGLDKYGADQLPQLVAFPVVHADSFAAFPGDIRIVYRNYSMYAGFEYLLPKGVLHSFGSCLHLGLRLASWLGCPQMYLVGADCAFEQAGEGAFRSHAKGLHFEDWADGHDIKWFEENRDAAFLPYELASSASGAPVLTDRVYRNWAREYELEATDPRFAGRVVQCSESCPKLEGIPFVPFTTITSSMGEPEASNIDFKAGKKPAGKIPPYFVWISNLKGYRRKFQELQNLLGSSPTEEEIQTLHVYFSSILARELFFSNWVLQCSTRETATCWNYINLLSLDVSKDDEKTRQVRLAGYGELINVFNKTITLLVEAIESGERSHYGT